MYKLLAILKNEELSKQLPLSFYQNQNPSISSCDWIFSSNHTTIDHFTTLRVNMTIFSIRGKGLKFDSSDDVANYVAELNAMLDVEEVHLSGNTFGVEASRALATALANKTKLRVSWQFLCISSYSPFFFHLRADYPSSNILFRS